MQDSLFSLLIRPTVWAFCKLNFEVSSHPRVGAILIMGVLTKGVCGFY